MDENLRTFVLQATRFRHGAIESAIGTVGRWPFRREISYQAGVNCDSIAVHEGKLHVRRRGRTIAVAELIGNPTGFGKLLRSLRRISGIASRVDSHGTSWESMLRPRRPK
jgi:hypothetical protein